MALISILPISALAAGGNVVISQVYGGGGNSGAMYKNDFIEIFNRSGSAVSLNGWSVQYASATGTTWATTNLTNVSLQPGQYYLIQGAAGSGGTVNLPTPDVSGAPNLSGTNGKIALVNSTTALSGACPTSATIVDLVGYGTANCSEPESTFASSNNAPAPNSSNMQADLRAAAGCTDTDNNASDFSTATTAPRNSGTTLNPCSGAGGGSTNPSGVGAANPASVQLGASTLLTVSVTQGSNPTSAIASVQANLSSIGGSTTQAFYDDGSNGDMTAGDGVYSYTATIPSNATTGNTTLPVTITDGVPRTGSASIALTVTTTPLTIMQIQGHGAASPYANQTVVTQGNVVTAVGPKGFFMQDPLGDNDQSTSDGVYVYLGVAPTSAVGDLVNVTGQVQEYNGSTEIAASPSVTKTGTGKVPAAIELNPSTDPTSGRCTGGNSTVNPPVDGYAAANYSCLDGMLVQMSDGIVTGATFASGADGVHTGTPSGFYATPSSLPRPFREPGAQYPGLSGVQGPVFDGDPEIIEIYYSGLGFNGANYIYNVGQHFQMSGIVQGYQGSYEVYPTTLTTVGSAPTYPIPIADSTPGSLTIGTQNMLHFFNNTADGADTSAYNDTCAGTGANDTCPTAAEYATRLAKMSLQIRTVLKAPVVLGVEEVENRKVANDLVNQIHSDDSSLTYVPYSIPGNDPGGINIGILVRSDVTVNSVTQMYKGQMTQSCSSNPPCLLNDRPPVLLDGVYNGYHFHLLVIYDRSLINLGVAGYNYVGTKRTEEAVQVASIVQTLQTTGAVLSGAGDAQQAPDGTITTGSFDITGDASVPLIVVGDFNAYEFSDGYVDVTGMISGTAVKANNYYWDASGTYVPPSPVLFDTGSAATPANHYSYNFSGYAQEIDHILLSDRGRQDFIAIGNAHGNSDVSQAGPAVLDATTAARTSDHDGQVVTLGYVVTPSAGANGTISPASVLTVSNGAQPTFTVTPATGYTASVAGTCGGALSGTMYTTAAVSANCSVNVSFALSTYTVSATAGANGSITPASQNVTYGGAASFTVTPNAGYSASLSGDTCTVSTTDGTTWTTSAITSACAVSATFTLNSYLVTATAGSNGSITPASQSVNYGSTATFTVTPNAGYTPVLSGDTCTLSQTSGTTWTSSAITSACNVSASFSLNTFTVTAAASGSNGSITPSTQSVGYGGTASFTVTPGAHYAATLSGDTCSASNSGGNIWTTTPITSNCAISASFSFVGGFVPVTPARVLDTRIGIGSTIDGQFASGGPVAANGQINLALLGRGGIPASGVTAVVLNVTATDPSAAGYVTVFPSGTSLPPTSNLNVATGQTIPNLVIVKLGSNGEVSLFSGVASTDLIADVVGYFTTKADYTALSPQRILDTRKNYATSDGQQQGNGPVAANVPVDLPVVGRGGVPSSGVDSVVLNVTVTNPTKPGYITVWPSDTTQPYASNINFVAGLTIPNLVITKLSASGTVSLANSAGTTDLIADVMGWFPVSSELTTVTPARLLDTRSGATTVDGQFKAQGPLLARGTLDLLVAGRGNVPSGGVSAVVLNVTATNVTAPGYLTVWPTGVAQPYTSNLNFTAGQTIANLVIAQVGSNGEVSLFNYAGSTDVVVDVVGWFAGPQ